MTVKIIDNTLLKTRARFDGKWQDSDDGSHVFVDNSQTSESECEKYQTEITIEQ